MGDLKTSIILDLAGNLERQSRRFESSLGRLGSRGSRSLGLLSHSVQAASRGLDRLGNRYTGLITGAAGAGALRMVGNLSERMTQLGVDAGLSADKVDELRNRIFEISRAPDIRIDPSELITAIEEVVKATGDLPFAEKNIRNMGLVMRAAAASGQDVGAMVTELQKLDKTASPENIMRALDVFNVQGKAGAVAMRDLASVGPRVFAAYASKRKGADPATFVRELGAALQSIKGGTGNVEQAATSFEALMRVFNDPNKLKALRGAGIQVFDVKALKAGREELRPINEIMAEIVKKTNGRGTLLNALVGDAEAIRAITAPNLVENLRNYYKVEADGSTTMQDAARNAKEFNAALTSLSAAGKEFAARNLTAPIRGLADALNELAPEKVDLLFKASAGLVAITGALVVGNKVAQAGSGLLRLFRGGKGAAGAAGSLGAGAAIPVYVVNGPSSIWPGPGGKPGTPGKIPVGTGGSLLLAGQSLLPAALAATAGALSIQAGQALAGQQARTSSLGQLQEMRSRHMVMGGGPGSFQVRTIDAELSRRLGEGMSGTLKIEIDTQGQPRVKQMIGRNLDLEVDSGRMMASH